MFSCKLTLSVDLSQSRTVTLPSNKLSRDSLLNELYACKTAQGFSVEGYQTSSTEKTMLYVLPCGVCDDYIELDFIALCLTPPLEDGVHTIENKLEMLSLPGNTIDTSRALLTDFEEEVSFD